MKVIFIYLNNKVIQWKCSWLCNDARICWQSFFVNITVKFLCNILILIHGTVIILLSSWHVIATVEHLASQLGPSRIWSYPSSLFMLLIPKADTHFAVPWRVEGWVTALMMCQLSTVLWADCDSWLMSRLRFSWDFQLLDLSVSIVTAVA